MVGLGETDDEIVATMGDMRAHDIDMLTLGPVPAAVDPAICRWCATCTPDAFAQFEREAYALGLPSRGRRGDGALVAITRTEQAEELLVSGAPSA